MKKAPKTALCTKETKKEGRVAKHANKKDEVRNHKGVSKPRLFA